MISRPPAIVRALIGVALLTSPVLLTTAWLYLARMIGSRAEADYVAWAVIVLATLAGLWLLPTGRLTRWVWTPIILVVAPVMSAFWAFAFACSAFGSCL